VIGGIALLVGMLVMLGFFASLGGKNRFGGLLRGFFALVMEAFWGRLIVFAIGAIVFFVVKALAANRQRPAHYERSPGTPPRPYAAVQCKRWKKWKVDVPKVRELFDAMTHEEIPRGVIVALNGFTLEAKQLAVEHNIDIIHDENLSVMIAGLASEDQRKVVAMLDDETKHCPKCEATMVQRSPKPGKNWTPFWGCSRYPQCPGRLQDD
jgi:hypothetical protein